MKQRGLKQKILILSAVAICAAMTAYGTVAYFTAEDTARNVITAGNVKIELQEQMRTDDGSIVPFTDQMDIMPGREVSKIVQVKNTGDQPAWIRIAVQKDIQLAQGVEGEVDLTLISFDLDQEHWSEKDGFYYYNTSLATGQTTEPLFQTVSFAKSMSNMYQHSQAIIQVDAQATQTANNGETVFDAAGWPEAE